MDCRYCLNISPHSNLISPEEINRAAQGVLVLSDSQLLKLAEQFDASTQYEKAIFCFDEAIKRNFSDATDTGFLYHKLGTCHWNLKHVEEAIASFRKSLELLPDNPSAKLCLCDALVKAKRYTEAKEVFKYFEINRLAYAKDGNLGQTVAKVRERISQWEKKQAKESIVSTVV